MLTRKLTGLTLGIFALSSPLVYADTGKVNPDQAVTAAQSPQSSPEGGHERRPHQHRGPHLMTKVLNLTDEQKKQLEDIQKKQWEGMKSVFEQLKANRQALSDEIIKASPDTNKINELQTQMKTIQSQMVDNRLNSLLEIKKIMSPEQFAGFMALKKAEKLKSHGDRHSSFHNKGHRGMENNGHWEDGDSYEEQ